MKLRTLICIGSAVLFFVAALSMTNNAKYSDGPGQDARELTALGEALFFDHALSAGNNTSCATCHVPEYSFTDRRRFSIGQTGKEMARNTPSLINRPLVGFQFWDGRALSLTDQIIHPLENPDEMGSSIEDTCRKLEEIPRYKKTFAAVFGTPGITPERLTAAIAQYLQTLQVYRSDYDAMKELGTLPASVLNGEKLFHGKANCVQCHTGRNFTDERFHNTGISWRSKQTDSGRGALTGRLSDVRAFKTPTLRELVRTARYMHDGSIANLEDVVDFYIKGGSQADPNIDPILKPIRLTKTEIKDLVAFLRSLSTSSGPPFRTPDIYKQK